MNATTKSALRKPTKETPARAASDRPPPGAPARGERPLSGRLTQPHAAPAPGLNFSNLFSGVMNKKNTEGDGSNELSHAFARAHEAVASGIAPGQINKLAVIEERTELGVEEIELIARSKFVARRMGCGPVWDKYLKDVMHMRISLARKSRSENLEAMKALMQVTREEINKHDEAELAKKRVV